ncbi:hypothetical protein BDZ91DRAFT_782500 [Kalaharituber pfeilii]|nr:hypothetical protein BDZ91DRAFT_782500 [Kalaharituber pfeilii]
MPYINYIIASPETFQKVLVVQVSLSDPVQAFLDVIHERNKLACGPDNIKAYCVDISLSEDGDLGPEWTEKALNILCTAGKCMRNNKHLKSYITAIDENQVQVLVKSPVVSPADEHYSTSLSMSSTSSLVRNERRASSGP